MKKFKYSLISLLLLLGTLCSVGACLELSQPWIFSGYIERSQFRIPQRFLDTPDKALVTPDGSRAMVKPFENDWRIEDVKTGRNLQHLASKNFPYCFADNDTFYFYEGEWNEENSISDRIEIWRRRFPEWWWGNFYRPEVWLTIIFGSLWLWRVARWFREQRKRPVQKPL